MTPRTVLATSLLAAACSSLAAAEWVVYENQTADRLIAPQEVIVNDNLEQAVAHLIGLMRQGWAAQGQPQ